MKNVSWKKILVIFVAVMIVLGPVKNAVIKTVVTMGASQVTGTKVKIDKFALGIFTQSVRIKGFRMYNPKGFSKDVMVDISEIRVDYNLPALLKGKLHLPLIVLDLKELGVVKNEDGQLNVDALKVVQDAKKPSAAKDKPEAKKKDKKSKPLAMQIDVAKLNLGRVVYKDYSEGGQPQVQVFDIGINDKIYKDITSAQQLATLVLAETMKQTAIKGAKVYAAAAILGVGFLPAGIAGAFIATDSGTEQLNAELTKVFKVALETVQKMGIVESQDEGKGVIKGKVDGADITIGMTSIDRKKTEVKVSARKFMLPKPEIAKGVLYEIAEKLK